MKIIIQVDDAKKGTTIQCVSIQRRHITAELHMQITSFG